MNAATSIKNYHAHVYFSAGSDEEPAARALTEAVGREFGDRISAGRFHVKPVGPHPRGSCLITIETGDFEPVVTWLARNRGALTVFCHINTDDAIPDHTDHVIWLGQSEDLWLKGLGV